MEMKRCAKGHFFDVTKYTTCPYCVNNDDDNDKTMAVMPEELEEIGSTVALEENNNIAFGQDMGTYQVEKEFETFEDSNDDKTVPMDFHDFSDGKEDRAEADVTTKAFSFPEEEWSDATIPDDLEDMFQDAGYQPELEEKDQGKTMSIFSMTKVVGWLVCVKGSEKGKDFVLGSGRNFIGRSPSMDVSLIGDLSISREKHAVITYNPRGNNFSISYGTGHGIVYLNGEEVLASMKLNPYDQIELGETILIFIPFCGENFKWEESK